MKQKISSGLKKNISCFEIDVQCQQSTEIQYFKDSYLICLIKNKQVNFSQTFCHSFAFQNMYDRLKVEILMTCSIRKTNVSQIKENIHCQSLYILPAEGDCLLSELCTKYNDIERKIHDKQNTYISMTMEKRKQNNLITVTFLGNLVNVQCLCKF